MEKKIKPLVLLALLFSLIIIADLSGFARVFHLETLRQHQKEISEYVANNQLTAPLTFIGVYIICAACCLPVAAALSLLAGFLFPQPFSTLYVLIGATAGATLLYFAAKLVFGQIIHNSDTKSLTKIGRLVRENAISCMLFLRFVPIFPFWFVNVAPALVQIPVRTYIWTTFVGILPVTIAFTQLGKGFNAILQGDGPLTHSTLLNPEIKVALLCLGVFALIPVFINRSKNRATRSSSE